MIYIYGMLDPRTKELRYVGKTAQSLEHRLRNHISRANLRSSRHSSRWIAGIIASGEVPDIFEIEILPDIADWQSAERFWIEYFKSIGCRLTNISTGGESRSGIPMTAEQKENLRQKFKGRCFDDVWREKISKAKKGVPGKRQDSSVVAARATSIRAAVAKRRADRVQCRNGHPASMTIQRNDGRLVCRGCKKDYYERTKVLRPPGDHPLKGRTLPQEWRANLAIAAKRRAANPIWRANHSATMKQLAENRKGKS